MLNDVLRTRLDRWLFAIVFLVAIVTVAIGAIAVHEHESRIAERQQVMVLVAQDVGTELPA